MKINRSKNNAGTVNAKTAVHLKYLSNIRRILEMLLIDCEINLILTSQIVSFFKGNNF